MSNPFGDSFSAVQSADTAQQEERDRRSDQAHQAFLAGQQIALQRQQQAHNFLLANQQMQLENRKLDIEQKRWEGMVNWRNQQQAAQADVAKGALALKAKQIDAVTQGNIVKTQADDRFAQIIVNNHDEAQKSLAAAQSQFNSLDEQRSRLLAAAQRDRVNGRIAVDQNGVVTPVAGKSPEETQQNQAIALSYNSAFARIQPAWQQANAAVQKEGADLNATLQAASQHNLALDQKTGTWSNPVTGKTYNPTPAPVATSDSANHEGYDSNAQLGYQPVTGTTSSPNGTSSAPNYAPVSANSAAANPAPVTNAIQSWQPAAPGSNSFPTIQFGSQAHQSLSPGTTYRDSSDGKLHIKAGSPAAAAARPTPTVTPDQSAPATNAAASSWQPALSGSDQADYNADVAEGAQQ
jgi:hypothetical protein